MVGVIITTGYPKILRKVPLTFFTSENKHFPRTRPPRSVSARMIFTIGHIRWLFICIGVTHMLDRKLDGRRQPSVPGTSSQLSSTSWLYSHMEGCSGRGGHWLHNSQCFPLVGVVGFWCLHPLSTQHSLSIWELLLLCSPCAWRKHSPLSSRVEAWLL